MANLSATILPKIMALYNAELQARTEMRTAPKPFIGLALGNSQILQPDMVAALREAEDDRRPVYANRLIRPTSTSGTARETTHTGPDADSASDLLVWATYTEKLSHNRQKFDDNIVNSPLTMAMQIQEAIDKIMGRVEVAGIAFVESNKTGVNVNNGQLAIFDGAADVLEVALVDIARSPYVAVDNMYQNNYSPRYDVLADNFTMAKYREIFAQGMGNNVNNGWQNFGDFDALLSSGLTNGAYSGISYWMPKFSVAALDWIPAANKRGEGDSPNSENGILGTITDPRYPGVNFAVSLYTTRTDTHATNGGIQSYVRQMEISLDVSYMKSELSTASETVIHAVGQLAS